MITFSSLSLVSMQIILTYKILGSEFMNFRVLHNQFSLRRSIARIVKTVLALAVSRMEIFTNIQYC